MKEKNIRHLKFYIGGESEPPTKDDFGGSRAIFGKYRASPPPQKKSL